MEKNQFAYFLKLIPRLLEPGNWSGAENDIVARHFEYLKNLLSEGRLILAAAEEGEKA